MKRCARCGRELNDNANFCDVCGSDKFVYPGRVRPAGNKMRCPKCGAVIADGNAAFCPECGAGLNQAGGGKKRGGGKAPKKAAPKPKKKQPEIKKESAAKAGKSLLIVLAVIILAVSLFFGARSVYLKHADEKEQKQIEDFRESFEFEGDSLIRSAEYDPNSKELKNVIFAKNNLNEFDALDGKALLRSISIYEAQVIYDCDNDCFALDKGYDIGSKRLAFNHASVIAIENLDTGQILLQVNDFSEDKLKNGKIYNIRCNAYEKSFDSYFRYSNGKFISVTAKSVDMNDINCAWDDNKLYLAYPTPSKNTKYFIDYNDNGVIAVR